MQPTPKAICAAVAVLFVTGASLGQTADTLRDAAQKAVQTNPEVTARFNAYRAAGDAVHVARGGFLPRVDLNALAGQIGRAHV